MAKFQDYLKNIFWVLLILQFAPPVFRSVRKQWLNHVEPKNKVGVIILNNVIMSSSTINQQLRKFFKDPEIKAVLFKMDCPGGAAGASQAICQEILQLKKQYPKPIVTYTENLCASGGYYIASTTDHIVATSSALIGSIGSKLPTQFKLKEFLQNYKIQTHSIASSNFKNSLDPFSDLNDDEKKMLQDVVNDCYDQFANDIAKYRHLNIAQKNIWAEGRIFTGNEALKLRLIDTVGNQTTAIEFIKRQILHADREIELVRIAAPSRFQQWLHPDADQDSDDVETSLATNLLQGLFYLLQKPGMMF